jgi:hypothetical protein
MAPEVPPPVIGEDAVTPVMSALALSALVLDLVIG